MNTLLRRTARWALLLCFSLGNLLLSAPASAQRPDTVRLSLRDAEQIFLEKNLSLVAARYDIDINKALAKQAALWDNPILETDQNIYSNKRFFEHGKDASGNPVGQYFIQVQQLIKTAGKRSKLMDMAASNTRLAELQFGELMRTLKYQLRADYYQSAVLQEQRKLLLNQLQTLQKLQTGMQAQLTLGNIAQKEYLRVQSLVIGIQQDLTDNQRDLWDVQTELKTLLQITSNSFVQTEPVSVAVSPDTLRTDQLMEKARQYNTAYLIQQETLQYQQKNLLYQQALRVPDIMIGPEYDHNSNYTPRYVGLSISLPLPLLNKNQGNIKAARISVKQQETNLVQAGDKLTNDVQGALLKLYATAQTQLPDYKQFYTAYSQLMDKMAQSYQQRQISLVEFADFFDNYREMISKQNNQQLNYLLSIEELNYQAGTDVIHP